MKWISKYDFFDLYKIRPGGFNPGSDIDIRKIGIPNENTIILGGTKEQINFDPKLYADMAVLFVSTDKGKSYAEILLNSEFLMYLESKGDYTMVVSSSFDEKAKKTYKIQLLNHKTLELKKIDSYSGEFIFYGYFDGKYLLKSSDREEKLINVHDTKEQYLLPMDEIGIGLFHTGDAKIVYRKNQEIIEYDAKTKESRLLNRLKKRYDYFFYRNDELVLEKKILLEGKESIYDIYNIYEEKLYEENNENKSFYRYGDFVCDYRSIGSKPIIRFSYDRGKTWITHRITEFTILQNLFGFYKDEFLVTDGIFWRGQSSESGGRIMVGEFERQ